MLLQASGLVAGYRLGTVLNGLGFGLPEGGSLAVLGRNGVGKTTLIHTLLGLVRPSSGSIRIDGQELAGRRTSRIARAGVAVVPQGRRIFGPLTVAETLELAASLCRRKGPWNVQAVLERFPRLGERLDHEARQLSGGEQQMLAISRALLMNPRLLLLDEPSEGLAPAIVNEIGGVVQGIRRQGVGVLIVEQDLHLAFAVADQVRVLDKGRFVYEGTTQDFRSDRERAHRLLGIG